MPSSKEALCLPLLCSKRHGTCLCEQGACLCVQGILADSCFCPFAAATHLLPPSRGGEVPRDPTCSSLSPHSREDPEWSGTGGRSLTPRPEKLDVHGPLARTEALLQRRFTPGRLHLTQEVPRGSQSPSREDPSPRAPSSFPRRAPSATRKRRRVAFYEPIEKPTGREVAFHWVFVGGARAHGVRAGSAPTAEARWRLLRERWRLRTDRGAGGCGGNEPEPQPQPQPQPPWPGSLTTS